VFESWNNTLESLNPSYFTIVLEGLEKPGNLGAIIRTCDALGVKQVIVSSSEIDLFNPNVLRNSRGGIFNVDVVFVNNDQALGFIVGNNLKAYAAVLSKQAQPIEIVKQEKVDVVVFGPESSGLSTFWLNEPLEHVIIPMKGIVDSLNLSVSVAIVCSHLNK
jgi:TrmH family RNA methyltransferase